MVSTPLYLERPAPALEVLVAEADHTAGMNQTSVIGKAAGRIGNDLEICAANRCNSRGSHYVGRCPPLPGLRERFAHLLGRLLSRSTKENRNTRRHFRPI